MFESLEIFLISLAEHIHLAIFSPLISFLEEIVPPIPSPSVMIVTGSLAKIQGYFMVGLLILTLLGALGKTFGAIITYFIADKVEDLLAGKMKSWIGISHEQVESFGKHLGWGIRDYVVLIFLRALPVIPSSVLSVGCGLLKINFKLFIISTFFGSLIRNFIFIYLGYTGTEIFISLFKDTTNSIESFIKLFMVIVIIILLIFLYFYRKTAKK